MDEWMNKWQWMARIKGRGLDLFPELMVHTLFPAELQFAFDFPFQERLIRGNTIYLGVIYFHLIQQKLSVGKLLVRPSQQSGLAEWSASAMDDKAQKWSLRLWMLRTIQEKSNWEQQGSQIRATKTTQTPGHIVVSRKRWCVQVFL